MNRFFCKIELSIHLIQQNNLKFEPKHLDQMNEFFDPTIKRKKYSYIFLAIFLFYFFSGFIFFVLKNTLIVSLK